MSAPGMVRAAAKSRDDWETPAHVFHALDREFHFELDGAATELNSKCPLYLSNDPLDNGPANGGDAFKYEIGWWKSIWVNPPYGNLMPWVELFKRWADAGATVVALLPANTDTKWFESVWLFADEIRFVKGRIQFVGTTSSNPGGSMVVVYRGHSPVTDSPRVSLVEMPKP